MLTNKSKKDFFAYCIDHANKFIFIILINIKMTTIVGILTLMSMINCMLSSVEHKKLYNLWSYSFNNTFLYIFCHRSSKERTKPLFDERISRRARLRHKIACLFWCSLFYGFLGFIINLFSIEIVYLFPEVTVGVVKCYKERILMETDRFPAIYVGY